MCDESDRSKEHISNTAYQGLFDECLAVRKLRKGKLFCTAGREELELVLKKSTVKNHINSGDKHRKAKERLAKKKKLESETLFKASRHTITAGTNKSMEQRVYRVKVVEQFLRARIALAKVDSLRGVLEEGALKLTHSSHLADYVPVIQGEEKKRICSEIDGQDVSIIFDGTTRLGEALAVVLHFFSGWKIQQRLVWISLLAKSMTGEEAAQELLTVLSTELGIAALPQ